MKKTIIKNILYLLSFTVIIATFLNVFDKVTYSMLQDKYNDSIGSKLFDEKFKGVGIQEVIFSKKDTLPIFGSSELSTVDISYNPINVFDKNAYEYQAIPIGRGYSQSLIHAINFAALKDNLAGKKLVFIISPQWFAVNGLAKSDFPINFSEVQYLKLMNDPKVSNEVKTYISKRVYNLSSGNDKLKSINFYAKIHSSNSILNKMLSAISEPNYYFKYKVSSIKEKILTIKYIKKAQSSNVPSNVRAKKALDWDKELKNAEEIAKPLTNNNSFYVDNSYYDKYMKDRMKENKGVYKNYSYLNSPEYEDFKTLLEICKENNIKPLFVSVPVNKRWYDYCEFPSDDLAQYYKNVSQMVNSYRFPLLDLSSKENEPYVLKDIMHLGWKGWIYIDKKIDEYYNTNR